MSHKMENPLDKYAKDLINSQKKAEKRISELMEGLEDESQKEKVTQVIAGVKSGSIKSSDVMKHFAKWL